MQKRKRLSFVFNLKSFKKQGLLLFLFFYTFIGHSQILLNESFNSSFLPVGWTNTVILGTQAWTIRNSPFFSSASSGYYAVFDDAALGVVVFPNEAKLVSPVFNASGRFSLKINFTTYWASVEGSHGYVEVSSDNGATWNIVNDYSSFSVGTIMSPVTETLNISAFISSQMLIRFRYSDGSSTGKYWYIDDIIIYSEPDVGIVKLVSPQYLGCTSPTAYSNNESITVRIFNFGINSISNIPLKCEVSGGLSQTATETFSGTIVGGSYADYTFAATFNLSPVSEYHFKTYTELSTDQFFQNDTLLEGRHQRISTFPFFESFEGLSAAGWQTGCSNTSGSDRWFQRNIIPYLNGAEGNGKSWFINTSPVNNISDEIWVESPVFDFTNVTNPTLSFDIKYQLHNNDYVWVQYSVNGGLNWLTLGSNTDADWYNGVGTGNNYWINNFSAPVSQWLNVKQKLCTLSGEPCVIFRIRARPLLNNIGNYYFAFDNFRISATEADDIEPLLLFLPKSGACSPLFTSTENVNIVVRNNTCRSLFNIPVTLVQSGAGIATLNETISGPVNKNERFIYNFTGTLNLINSGTHTLTATTGLTTDSTVINNIIIENRYASKINTFPVLADFNSNNCGWVSGSNDMTNPNNRIFLCDTLPYLGNSNGNGRSWYIDVSSVNSTNNEIWVESPEYDFTNVSTGIFSMDIKYQLHNNDYVWVEYSTNGGNSWSTLGTNSDPDWYNTTGANNNYWRNNLTSPVTSWKHVQHTLCNLTGKPCVKFRIKARPYLNNVDVSGGYYYFAFDNIQITETANDIGIISYNSPLVNPCLYGQNEQVGIMLYNFSCSPQTNIPVQCNISGAINLTLTDTIITDTIQPGSVMLYSFATLVDMSAPGVYDLTSFTNLTSDINQANDTISEHIFVSQIKISSYPYQQDFNSDNGYWIFGSSDTTVNHRWFERGLLPYLNGPELNGNSWFINTDTVNSQTEEIWVESPVFDFSTVSEAILSMDIKYQFDNNDYAWVQYSSDGGTSWLTLGSNTDANWYNATGLGNNYWRNNYSSPVSNWTTVQHFLCNLAGAPCVKFRIKARPFSSQIGSYYFAFDNFKITEDPSSYFDVGITSLNTPAISGCLYSPPDKFVNVSITNFGCSATTNIPVTCNVSGPINTILTGTMLNSITSNSFANFIFPTSINMADTGTYSFVVFTNLSGDIDHSNDTAAFSIKVDQIKIDSFPYSADFNISNQYWKTGGNDTTANDRWFERNVLPYLNGTQGNGNSFFINTNIINTSNEEIWAESPVFDFTNNPNPFLSLDIKYQLHNFDYVWVQYSIDGGSSWSTLGSNGDSDWYSAVGAGNNYWRNNIFNPVNSWTKVKQSLCFLSGKSCVKFRIIARPYYNTVDINGGYYYFAFDNFKIEALDASDDVQPIVFFQPDGGNCVPMFSISEPVTIVIQNNSCRNIENIPVSIIQTGVGSGTLSDIVQGPISRYSKYVYTFTGTLNMSDSGTHILTAVTNLTTDSILGNNTHTETRNNNAISVFPYSEIFDINNGGWVSGSDNYGNPNNRIFLMDSLPYLNGPENSGKSWFIDVSSVNSVTDAIWVESPVFNLSSLTDPKLKMDIKSQLHNSNYVWVEYSTDGGNIWATLGTNTDPDWYNTTGANNNYWRNNLNNPDTTWKTVQHSLCNLVGNACVKFRIKARPYYNTIVTSPNYTGYYFFAFDNFKIVEGGDVGILSVISPTNPECLFSTAEQITVNVFNWGCSSAINFPLTCNISGILSTVISGILTDSLLPGTQTAFTFPATIDMTQTGVYSFAASTQLAGDINQNNDTLHFQYLLNQIKINTFPYLQDFNSGSAYWLTGSSDTTVNHRWFQMGTLPYLNGAEGQGNSWYINTDAVNSQTEEIWVESPIFDFSGIVNPTLSFHLKYQLHNFDYCWIEYSINGGVSWTTLGTNTDQNWYNTTGLNNNYWRNNSGSPVSQWTTFEHNLCELAGQSCVKFRFKARPFYNQPGSYYFAFDNFHIYSSNLDVQTLDVAGCYGADSPIAIRIRNNSNLYTCGNGIVSASSEYNTLNSAMFAFDGNTTTSGWGNSNSLPSWLEYNFAGNPTVITKYKILCSSTQSGNWNSELYNPKTWKFQAFDGNSWVTLDSVADGLLQMDVVKEFPVTNINAYERYRIYITAAEGGQRVHVTEMFLLPAPNTIPTINSITLNCNINGIIVSNIFSGLNLAPGSDTMLILTGTFVPDANSTVIIWNSLPNGQIDLRNYNDTIKPDITTQWPNCNIHCINATELINSITISSSTYNLPDHPIYDGSTEDYNLNICADPDTFTVDQSVWYYFHTDCNGGNVKITFQSLNNGPLGIQVAILQIPDDTCACNPIYYNNVFCSTSDAASSTIIFNDTLPVNSLYYIMIDPSGNTASDFMIILEGSVDTLNAEIGSDTIICSADSITLTCAETGTYRWWIQGDTSSIISTNQSFYISPDFETTYFAEVTSISGCKDVDSIKISVNPSYFANISPVLPLCSDSPPINLVAADTGGLWSGSGITDTAIGLFNPVIAGAGTHQIIYTIQGTCGDTDTTNIIINIRRNADITPTVPFCSDDFPFVLIAAETGGIWSGNGITDSLSGLFNPLVSGVGIHAVIYTIEGSCGDADTTLITINAIPNPTINPVGFICIIDTAIILTAVNSGGVWTGSGITDSINGTFNPALAGTGNHQIIYTIYGMCVEYDTIILFVNALYNASVTPIETICISEMSFVLQSVDTGGIWLGNGISNPNTGLFNPTVAGLGNHQIIYSISGSCGDADTVFISVVSQFNTDITTTNSFCNNSSPVLLSTVDTGGSWYGNGITDTISGLFNPVLAGAGIHQVIYTIYGSCGNSDTVGIIVESPLNVDIISTGPYCQTDTTVLLSVNESGGLWTGSGITNQVSGIFNPSLIGSGTSLISYSIPNACQDYDSTNITVISLFNTAINPISQLCISYSPVMLTAANSGGIWSGSGITDSIFGIFDPAVAGQGTHSVIYAIAGYCGNSDTANIIVNPVPITTITNDTSICQGKSVTLIATGGNSYNWSNNSSNAMITVTPTSSIWYFVTVSIGMCSVKDSVRITIHVLPNATASGNSPICQGEIILLTSGGGTQYIWSGPSGFMSMDQNPIITNAQLINTGNYNVTVSGINGCTKNASTNIIVGNNFNAIQDTHVCSGKTYVLPGGNIASSTGTYIDTLQTILGCDSIIITNLTVYPSPQIVLSETPDTVLLGQSIRITANGAEQFIWNTGENTQTITNTPSSAGLVSICVTGSNIYNCQYTKCADIIVKIIDCGDGQLFVPNAFSPNGDGSNDLLCIYGKACITDIDFRIFDRWGEMVYESNEKENCWKGIYRGKELNAAVFVYFLEATLIDGAQVKLQGNISLVK